jgi:hypothetical protein
MPLGEGVHFSVFVDSPDQRGQSSSKPLVFRVELDRAQSIEQAKPTIVVFQGNDWRGRRVDRRRHL